MNIRTARRYYSSAPPIPPASPNAVDGGVSRQHECGKHTPRKRPETAQVQVVIDAVDANTAQIAQGYPKRKAVEPTGAGALR